MESSFALMQRFTPNFNALIQSIRLRRGQVEVARMVGSKRRFVGTVFAGLLLFFPGPGIGHVQSAELTLKLSDRNPPQELDASIRETLAPKAIQLREGGGAVYEFWFRKELPLKSKPESVPDGLKAIGEATLVGAVAVLRKERDYRDDELYKGVYTMRFSLQPQDGNHLGTSDYPYFVALTPARLDTKPEGITTYKDLVKASSKETSTGHPVIVSLRPVSSADGTLPQLTQPAADHKAVRVRVPGKAAGEEVEVIFDLVYEGKAEQ